MDGSGGMETRRDAPEALANMEDIDATDKNIGWLGVAKGNFSCLRADLGPTLHGFRMQETRADVFWTWPPRYPDRGVQRGPSRSGMGSSCVGAHRARFAPAPTDSLRAGGGERAAGRLGNRPS